MFSVGITGGMGSGKTLVCKIFSILKIPIYHSDEHAKRLMTVDSYLKSEIINLLGKKCYDENGAINRKYISQKVFNNKSLLYMLQAIVHPAVMKDAKVWSEALPQTSPYFLRESAILFETGNYKELDFNILVIAPKAIRIERIKRRDGLTSEEIDVRLQQQWPEKKKQSLADFIIINDENTFLIPQILRIHLELHQIALRQRDMLLNINS